MMDFDAVQSFTGGLGIGSGFAGAFFAIKWFMEYISGRMDRKEARLDRIQNELIKQLLEDVAGLKAENSSMRTDIDSLHKQLLACEKKHAQAEGEMARLRASIDSTGQVNQKVQQIVAANRLSTQGEPS